MDSPLSPPCSVHAEGFSMAPGPLDPVQGASEQQRLKSRFGLSSFCKAPAKRQPARMKKRHKGIWVSLGGSETRPLASLTRAADITGSHTWPRRKAIHTNALSPPRAPPAAGDLSQPPCQEHLRPMANPLTAGFKSCSLYSQTGPHGAHIQGCNPSTAPPPPNLN